MHVASILCYYTAFSLMVAFDIFQLVQYTVNYDSFYEKYTSEIYLLLHLFAEPIEVNLPAKEEMRNFDSVIVNFLREQGIPGASLCIAKGGHVIYTQSKNALLEYYILSDRTV